MEKTLSTLDSHASLGEGGAGQGASLSLLELSHWVLTPSAGREAWGPPRGSLRPGPGTTSRPALPPVPGLLRHLSVAAWGRTSSTGQRGGGETEKEGARGLATSCVAHACLRRENHHSVGLAEFQRCTPRGPRLPQEDIFLSSSRKNGISTLLTAC